MEEGEGAVEGGREGAKFVEGKGKGGGGSVRRNGSQRGGRGVKVGDERNE